MLELPVQLGFRSAEWVGRSLDRLNLHVEWLGYSLDANETKGA